MVGASEQQGAAIRRRDQPRKMPRRASRVLPIQRLAAQARCTRCNDTGAVWVICPDAGAVKLPCDCASPPAHVGGIQLVDAGLAAAFLACCGVAYFLI